MKFNLLKFLILLILVQGIFFGSTAFAVLDFCKTISDQDIVRLESEVSIQGIIGINPMYSYDPINLNDNQENSMFVLNLNKTINLEQYNKNSENFSCPVSSVTLLLNREQRLKLNDFIQNKNLFFQVKGTIRWSESSIELAGNAVLSNATEISIVTQSN